MRSYLTSGRGGSTAKLQYFLVASTCLLYLVAAGLLSRSVWYFENQQWNNNIGGDAAELGDGAGSYDIDKSVWHVNVSTLPEIVLTFWSLTLWIMSVLQSSVE